MEASRPPPLLSLVAVLDQAAHVLGASKGLHRWEFLFKDGRVIEARSRQEFGKVTRSQLDAVTIPIDGPRLPTADGSATMS